MATKARLPPRKANCTESQQCLDVKLNVTHRKNAGDLHDTGFLLVSRIARSSHSRRGYLVNAHVLIVYLTNKPIIESVLEDHTLLGFGDDTSGIILDAPPDASLLST